MKASVVVRRAFGWYIQLIMIGAGASFSVFLVREAWSGDLSADTSPGHLWRRVIFAPIVMLVVPLFISGFDVVLLVGSPGFLVAAGVMASRGELEYAAPVAVIGLTAALPFFLYRFLSRAASES
jgi:hypothetical protein